MNRFLLQIILICIFLISGCLMNYAQRDITWAQQQIENLPASFRKNMGQWNQEILYQGSSAGWNASVNFMRTGLSFGFSRENEEKEADLANIHTGDQHEYLVWNMHFVNAQGGIEVIAEGRNESKTNYLLGNDAGKYVLNAPDYRKLTYKNIYHNIDLSYYSTETNLKYDYILKPGSDIQQIKLSCEGIKSLSVNSNGELEIHTLWGTLIEKLPESYQVIRGKKKLVDISYELLSATVFGFRLNEAIDESTDLVIDPVTLQWSTFVGSSVASGDGYIYDIDVDPTGNVYGTGMYNSSYPVTPGVYNTTYGGGMWDTYVFKLDPTGSNLLYATYVGGSDFEKAFTIKVNSSGETFVGGWVRSTDFPVTTGAYQTKNNSPAGWEDAFLFKLNAAGTGLIYSTYLGGSGGECIYGLDINSNGEAMITGPTSSGNFPTTAGCYNSNLSGGMSGFITKMNPTGTALIYSTYLGGSGYECPYALTGNTAGEIIITGYTTSNNFPCTAGAYDNSFNGGSFPSEVDAFVSKINPAGNGPGDLKFSTYLGGSGDDIGRAITTNSSGDYFVLGNTESVNFPVTAGVVGVVFAGGSDDCFVTKISSSGASLAFSTYLGGSLSECYSLGQYGQGGIAVNQCDEIYVSGFTKSADFPSASNAYDNTHNGFYDLFLTKLNNTATAIHYSSFIGGSKDDYRNAEFVLLPNEDIVMCGSSHSPDFPTTPGTFQTAKNNHSAGNYSGPDQPVVFKWSATSVYNIGFSYTLSNSCNSVTVSFTDTSNGGSGWNSSAWSPSGWQWDFGDGYTSMTANPIHTYTASGTYVVKLIVSCPNDSVMIPVTITLSGNLSATINQTNISCFGANDGGATIIPSPGNAPYTYLWLPGNNTGNSISNLTAGTYSVHVMDAAGCSKDTFFIITQPPALVLNISPVAAMCEGQSLTLSSFVNGGTPGYTYKWSNGQINTTTINIQPTASSIYSLTVTDTNNCESVTSTTIIVNAAPVISFFADDTAGCEALCINFSVQCNTPVQAYAWEFGDGNSSSAINPAYCYNSGMYSPSLTVTDTNGCTAIATNTNYIHVYPNPVASFVTNPSTAQLSNPVIIFTDQSAGATSWSWSFGDINNSSSRVQNPSFVYSDTGMYTVWLVAGNNYGCTDTAQQKIKIISDEYEFFIPNTFTPNGDGVNDYFFPKGLNVDGNNFEMMIFDRWGNLIYKTSDHLMGWDGIANYGKNTAQTDTYVWKINTQAVSGEKHQYTGHVNLIR